MARMRARANLSPKLISLAVASCFAAGAAFANPTGHSVVRGPGLRPSGGQPAADHQLAERDHQLAELLDRRERDHALHPAVVLQRGAEPRRWGGPARDRPLAHPRRAAIERARVPDQPERDLFGAGRADRRGGPGGLLAQSVERRTFLAGRMRFTDGPGARRVVNSGKHRTRRTRSAAGLSDRLGRHQQRHHHAARRAR